jgi:hypothetical protein
VDPVATRNQKLSTKSPKGGAKADKRGRAEAFNITGKRNQKSATGRRTTLRVPKSLDTEASRLARELKISGNEALVRLAALGAENARRKRDLRRVIERRHAAVMGSVAADAATPFPSAEEMGEAILAERD